MTIAKKVASYLREHQIPFELIHHAHSGSSMESAEAAHVSGDAVAKAVVLKGAEGHVMVVVPADYHIDLDQLSRLLGRELALAEEGEFKELFPDCEPGAVPPMGPAYGVKTLWDPEADLGRQARVFFEAGDHEHLVGMSGEHFHELMAPAERAHFSHHI